MLEVMTDYLRFVMGTLAHRRLRSWLTMIGIFIGIAALVALISLGEGLRGAILGQFGFLGPDVLGVQAAGIAYAGPPGSGAVDPLTEDLTDKIRRVPGVEMAINRYIETGTMEFNGHSDIVFAWNIPEGKDRSIAEEMLSLKGAQGRLLNDGDSFSVVVGNGFTDDEDFGKPVQMGSTITFKGVDFKVVGILQKEGSFIFDTAIIMNEKVLKDNFRRGDNTVNAIGIKAEDVSAVAGVKERVEQLLRRERNVKKGEENFTVDSPENTLQTLDQILFAVQLFVSIIALISIIVGGIGIANTMYTAVLERTKEIGIMKAIGARNSSIFTLFFIESGFLGLVGGVIGVLLGAGIALGGAAAGRAALGSDLIQAHISAWLIVGALAFSFCIGLAAGILPALRAAKKHPVESLRYAK